MDLLEQDVAQLQTANMKLKVDASGLHQDIARLIDELEGEIEKATDPDHMETTETTSFVSSSTQESKTVDMKDAAGRYVVEIELCLMRVLALGISLRQTWPVTKAVYESLTGDKILQNPSIAHLQDLVRRADVICDWHLAEEMMEYASQGGKNATAMHDNTTKKGRTLCGAQIQLGQKTHMKIYA